MKNFEKDFEHYYNTRKWDIQPHVTITGFKDGPFSMQWGVYVDFFDGHDIKIQIEPDQPERYKEGDAFIWYVMIAANIYSDDKEYINRQEARKAALEKAIEIYETT